MQFKIHKRELSRVINIAIKAVPSNPQIPILSGLLIEADGDGIAVTGNGVQTAIKAFAAAVSESAGKTVVDAKMIDNIVKHLPDGEVIFSGDGKSIKIRGGKSEFNISCMAAEDFPAIEPPENPQGFTIETDVLNDMLRKTIPFAAVSEGKKPVLMGIAIDVSENTLEAAASDGHKLAHVCAKIEYTGNPLKMIIPAENTKAIMKITADKTVDIYTDGRKAHFDYDNCQVYIRQIEGDFLPYRQLLNTKPEVKATVYRTDMINAVERAALIANTEIQATKPPVIFNVSGDKINTSCRVGSGTTCDEVKADVSGGNIRIGFSCRLLLDMLNACESDKVTFEMTEPRDAAYVHDGNAEFLVLPVRLYD